MHARTSLLAATVLLALALPAVADEMDDLGNPEKAIKRFTAAVEKAPDDSESWFNLGLAYAKAKKPADAIKALARAVELNPSSAPSQAWLGVVYLELKKPAEAVKPLEAALALNPELVEARSNLAQAYYEAGRWDNAIAAYKEMAKAKPANISAVYTQIGNAYLKKGEVDDAVKWFERTIEASPNDPDSNYNLAVAYRKIASEAPAESAVAMWKKAAAQFTKAAGMNPGDVKLLVYTADALAVSGDMAGAKTYLDRYFKADPDGKKAGPNAFKTARELKAEIGN